jgi:ribosomal protein S18 acetylase RimI-like enzyme
MFNLRGLRWPDDRDGLCALDTSFTTAHVYRVVATATAFILQEATVSPPLRKAYDLAGEVELFPTFDHVVIAERDAQVAGVAALQHDAADRRALLRHLYVGRAYRGQGIGRALMEATLARAQLWRARCVWLETQDVNYAAIQFYQRLGFQWCGLDLSLDEHDGSDRDETAVFFMRLITP